MEYYKFSDIRFFNISKNEYFTIGYKRSDNDIFYLNDNRTGFTNNIDEAFFCTIDDIPQPLMKFYNETDIMITFGISGDHLIKELYIYTTDMYRVVGYVKNSDNPIKVFTLSNTLNMANSALHLQKNHHKNDKEIELVIEKYFLETDEWYNIETGLTYEESLISKDLVNVVNRFARLPKHHPSHMKDMTDNIHGLQRLLQSRTCRRLYPNVYPLYTDKKGDE